MLHELSGNKARARRATSKNTGAGVQKQGSTQKKKNYTESHTNEENSTNWVRLVQPSTPSTDGKRKATDRKPKHVFRRIHQKKKPANSPKIQTSAARKRGSHGGKKSCDREAVFYTNLCSRCEQGVATLASAGTSWSSRRQPAVASTSHVVLRARNRAWERHSNGVTFWSGCSWRLDRRKFFWFDLNKHNVERNAVLFRQRHAVLLSTSNSEREVAKHEPDRRQMCGRLRDAACAAI